LANNGKTAHASTSTHHGDRLSLSVSRKGVIYAAQNKGEPRWVILIPSHPPQLENMKAKETHEQKQNSGDKQDDRQTPINHIAAPSS